MTATWVLMVLAASPPQLTVEGGPGCANLVLPANGQTCVLALKVLAGASLKDGAELTLTAKPPLEVLDPTATIQDGGAKVRVRATRPVSDVQALSVRAGDAEVGRALLVLEPVALDLTRLLGALASFVLVMLLLSVTSEKLTDMVKAMLRGPKWLEDQLWPERTVETWLSPQTLLTASQEQLERLVVVLDARPDPTKAPQQSAAGSPPTSTASCLEALAKEERRRTRHQATYSTWMRLLSAVFGALLACGLHLNALDYLSALVPTQSLPDGTGAYLLTGVASSLGAAFWQDVLDRLTSWKKGAQGVLPTK